MKYLKLFENNSDLVKVTIVDFTGGEDGVYACYVDGELEFYGDYYHDKITDMTKGFIMGLKWVKENYVYPLNVEQEQLKCVDSEMNYDISQNGNIPPKKLSEVSF